MDSERQEREKIAKALDAWKGKGMPALANPRWERFAQLIVEGLMNGDRKAYSQGRAYIAAGYEAKDAGKRGGSAEAAASRSRRPSLAIVRSPAIP